MPTMNVSCMMFDTSERRPDFAGAKVNAIGVAVAIRFGVIA